MTQSFGVDGDAQLASGRYASAYLVEMQFASGTLYLCTLPLTVPVAGNTYTGLGRLLRVDPIGTSEDGRADKVKISLSIGDDAVLASVLGNVAGYRGRRVTIWMQLFTDTFKPIGQRRVEWQGYMEPVSVSRSRGQGGITGRIEMPCTRAGLPRSRNSQGLRVTSAQQQQRYPGDLFCEYIQALVEQPYTWLSKRFQEIEG